MATVPRFAERPNPLAWTLGVAHAAALLVLFVSAPARGLDAQASPLVLEAHGGVALPLDHFASGTREGEGAGPGASFGVDFALPGGAHFAPYVGFAQHRFACEDAGCASGGRYVATGFHAGYRIVPLPGRAVLPWVRLGVITSRVETDALGGANVGTSKLGVGGEVGAGVHIGGASLVAVNPSVRLAALNTTLPGGALLRMRYLVADVAIVLSF
jgi:hypothetical protein